MVSQSDQPRASSNSIDPGDLKTLRTLLKSYYSLNELINLAVDLDIDHEEFPQTKSPFIREFISYCRRRNILNCLVLNIMQSRSLDNSAIAKELSGFLFKWGGCQDQVKMIIAIEENLYGQLSEFVGEIADRLNISQQEILVLGALRGSTRLFLRLPYYAAIKFFDSLYLFNELTEFKIVSLAYLRELNELNQTVWRIVAKEHPNIIEETRNWTVFPDNLDWNSYKRKAIKVIKDIQDKERGRLRVQEPAAEHVVTSNTPNFSSSLERGLAFIFSGFFVGSFTMMLLIYLFGDQYSAIQLFESLQYLTFEYETVAFLFGIIASIIVFWLQSDQIRWSFLFSLGYGLGFPLAALFLRFERNDIFMTLLGNLFIFLFISLLINNLLNLVRKFLTKHLATSNMQ